MINYKYTLVPISDFPRIENSATTTINGNILYDVPSNVEVKSLNLITGEVDWVNPKTFSIHPNVPLYLVQFIDGDFIFAAKDHSLLAYTDSGIEEVDTEEAVGRYCPSDVTTIAPNIQSSVLAEGMMGTRGMKGIRGKGFVKNSFNLQLNYKTGLFIGMVLGDGWVDNANQLFLAGSTKEKLMNRKVFADLCNSEYLPYENGVKEIDRVSENMMGQFTSRGKTRASCAWFNKWLKEQIGSGAFNKKIPTFSLNGPEEHLLGILDGLISTDGTVSVSSSNKTVINISICTSSIHLINGLRYMSKRLNLNYGVYKGASRLSGKDNFSFRFHTGTFKKLVERTKFRISHELKKEKLENSLKDITGIGDNFNDLVPLPSETVKKNIITAINNKYKLQKNKELYNLKYRLSQEFKTDRFRKSTLKEIIEILLVELKNNEQWISYLGKVYNGSLKWKKVKRVTKLQSNTAYDLEIPNYGSFLTIGGYTKNSDGDQLNVHIPGTEEARKEVIAKMMPSKNLLSVKSFQPVLIPSNEAALGLYGLSTENKHNTPKKYKTEQEVVAAYNRGDLEPGDNIEIEK
jgi:hypothetical protein